MNDPIESLQAALPERYRIERELARGGMSRVYLARESHPDRAVAIKVMDEQVTAHLGRERFLQEVNFTSRLTHPHIVPIFAAGEAAGSLYYVMPFVEGETLAVRLEREARLPIGDAVRIALHMAGALHYAHQNGVVHRDIKPGNVLLQGRHALVADFGVARALEEVEDVGMTGEGQTLGTPEYMAPEQAMGSAGVDGRADQYALACLLYEMLGGEPPFHGRTAQATLARHLSDSVPSLLSLRKTVGEELEGVILRALEKTPADRFQSVEEFADALGDAFASTDVSDTRGRTRPNRRPSRRRRALSIGSLAAAVALAGVVAVVQPWSGGARNVVLADGVYLNSAAVMPLENISGDPANDLLGVGLADEIIALLTRVPTLKVSPRYSAMALQRANLAVPEILETLGVQHMLQGTILVQGDRVRITVGLVDQTDTQTDTHIFEAQLSDWFSEQSRIATEVAKEFLVEIGVESTFTDDALPARGPGQANYLLGNEWLGRRTAEGIRRSIDLLWRSVEEDPDYGPAYASLSTAYAMALTYRYEIGLDGYVVAGLSTALADRAVELAPNSAAGWAARGFIRAVAGAPEPDIASDFDQAAKLQPNSPSVPSWSSRVLAMQGKVEEATIATIRAAELDPVHSGRQIAVAVQAYHKGDFPAAIDYADRALAIEPTLLLARAIKGRSLLLSGQARACLAMDLGAHTGLRALCMWESGDRDAAKALTDSLSTAEPQEAGTFTDVVRREDLAVFYGFTGNATEALRWIGEALAISPSGIEVRVIESAAFDPVRAAPGFSEGVAQLRAELWSRVLNEAKRPLRRP